MLYWLLKLPKFLFRGRRKVNKIVWKWYKNMKFKENYDIITIRVAWPDLGDNLNNMLIKNFRIFLVSLFLKNLMIFYSKFTRKNVNEILKCLKNVTKRLQLIVIWELCRNLFVSMNHFSLNWEKHRVILVGF